MTDPITDIIATFDEDIPVSAAVAAEREAVKWIMTHDISGQATFDEEAAARLEAQLPPPPDEPVTRESVDAMMVTTSLRIPLGTQRRLQAYADAHGVKPTALMREWVELMLTATEHDRPVMLHDVMRALAQLPAPQHQAAA